MNIYIHLRSADPNILILKIGQGNNDIYVKGTTSRHVKNVVRNIIINNWHILSDIIEKLQQWYTKDNHN